MMKNNIKRLSLFLAFLVALLSISVVCSSAISADRQEIDLDRVGITYQNKGMTSLYNLSQDENLLGDSGRQLVTLVFDFYIWGTQFKLAVEDYNSGLINAYDLMRIGYPNYIIYESFTITEEEDLDVDRIVYLSDVYPINQEFVLDGLDYSSDRDLSFTRYRVTVSYYQSASLPSYYSAYSSDGYTYATNLDYIYSANSAPISNFLIWCPVLGEYSYPDNYLPSVFIAPVKTTVSFGLPKAVSWSGNDNPMTVYTVCTFFDLYNSFLQYLYSQGMYNVEDLPEIVYQHTQSIKLVNDYYSYIDQEEQQYIGGMGWFEPWSHVYSAPPIGGYETDGYVFNYIEASKVEFSSGENVEYWPETVEFYKGISTDDIWEQTERLILIYQSSLNNYEYYDYQVELASNYSDEESIEPLAVFRPYVGAWASLDQTDDLNLTYDGSDVGDVDISEYYKDISFDMPKFDKDLSFGENLGKFFTGFIMALVTLFSSLINNAVVWFFCESPLLSKITKPVFLMFSTVSGVFTDYATPLLVALGLFAPLIAIPILIAFIRRNK